jgi:hypothetical protein
MALTVACHAPTLLLAQRCCATAREVTAIADTLDLELRAPDRDVHAAVVAELHRQQSTLEMIASENFAPTAVMAAQGSVLTNKYAEDC